MFLKNVNILAFINLPNFCFFCYFFSNAAQLTEIRLVEEQAQNHFRHLPEFMVMTLPLSLEGNLSATDSMHCSLNLSKVFHAGRQATTCAVPKCHQQGEAVINAQRSINQGKEWKCLQFGYVCRNVVQLTLPELIL